MQMRNSSVQNNIIDVSLFTILYTNNSVLSRLYYSQNDMDSGLCPGNYYDYLDDDIAKQRELELFDTWNGPGAFLGMWFVM